MFAAIHTSAFRTSTMNMRWQGPWLRSAPSSDVMLTALQIGVDPVLLRTRGAVIESAGFQVVSVASALQATAAIRATPFDVVILCHSLSRSHRVTLAAAVHRLNASVPVLLVSGGPGSNMAATDGMDGVLEPEPDRLLLGLRRIPDVAHKSAAKNRTKKAGQA